MRSAILVVLVACSSDAPPPVRAAPPVSATAKPIAEATSVSPASASAPAPRTEPFVGVWRIDAQAHFDMAGSDPDEKRLALAMARAHLELVIGADGGFELRSTREPSVAFTGQWHLQRTDGNRAWLLVESVSPQQERFSGTVRLVLRDPDHLEYYKQIGEPPEDDQVVFYVRAKK